MENVNYGINKSLNSILIGSLKYLIGVLEENMEMRQELERENEMKINSLNDDIDILQSEKNLNVGKIAELREIKIKLMLENDKASEVFVENLNLCEDIISTMLINKR